MTTKKRTKRVAIRRFVPVNGGWGIKEWIWRKGHGMTVYYNLGFHLPASHTIKTIIRDPRIREVPAKGK